MQYKIKDILEEAEKSFKLLEEITRKPEVNDEANIRQLLSDEHEAVSKYQKFADDTKDERVRKVLLDIKGEEVVHSGELTELLKILGINDTKEFKQGEEEVKKTLKENLVKDGTERLLTHKDLEEYIPLEKVKGIEYLPANSLKELDNLTHNTVEVVNILQQAFNKYYPNETLTDEELKNRSFRVGKEICSFGDALANTLGLSVDDTIFLLYSRILGMLRS